MDNMEEYEYVQRSELADPGTLKGAVGYKPYTSIIVVSISGIAILAVARNHFGLLICLLFLAISAFIYFGVKDHGVMEIYDKVLYLLDVTGAGTVLEIPYEKIKTYCVNKDNNNVISLTLEDGQCFQTMSFQRGKASRLLHQVLPGKSEEEEKLNQLKNMKASGFSALKGFRGFGKK